MSGNEKGYLNREQKSDWFTNRARHTTNYARNMQHVGVCGMIVIAEDKNAWRYIDP